MAGFDWAVPHLSLGCGPLFCFLTTGQPSCLHRSHAVGGGLVLTPFLGPHSDVKSVTGTLFSQMRHWEAVRSSRAGINEPLKDECSSQCAPRVTWDHSRPLSLRLSPYLEGYQYTSLFNLQGPSLYKLVQDHTYD